MLVDGKWVADWQPVQKADEKGRFVRQTSSFRNWITPDGSPGPTSEGGFVAEAGRYRLYVALICPWASRTLIARSLKGLQALIPVTVVNPVLTAQGWQFGGYPGTDADPLFAATYMHQIYTLADDRFTGRATVPVLWDMARNVMVSNESADILGSGQNMGVVVGDLACAKVRSLRGGLPWTYGLQSKLPSTTGRRALISLKAFLDPTG